MVGGPVIVHIGSAFTLMECVSVAVQPFVAVTVTEYVTGEVMLV